jgi:hypothetical protein
MFVEDQLRVGRPDAWDLVNLKVLFAYSNPAEQVHQLRAALADLAGRRPRPRRAGARRAAVIDAQRATTARQCSASARRHR